MFSRSQLLVGGTALVLSVAAIGRGADETISIDKAPAAVRDAIKKAIPNAPATQVSKEEEDGKAVYEVEYKVGDVTHTASFAADGKLLEEEEDAKMSDLPAAVSAAITKAVGDGKVAGVSKVKADGKTYYEADYTAGKDKHEVKVAADGSVISNKVAKEDDEKDEKGEKKD